MRAELLQHWVVVGVMRRHSFGSILLASLITSGVAAASAETAQARPFCGPTARIVTIKQTAQIRVFADRARRRYLYFCRRSATTSYALAQPSGAISDGQTLGRIVGRYLNVTECVATDGLGGDACSDTVVDTRTGRYLNAGGAYQTIAYSALQVSRFGHIVWLRSDGYMSPTQLTVVALGPDGLEQRLDSGPDIRDLRLQAPLLSWTSQGQSRQVTLGAPPRYTQRLRAVRFRRS